MKKRREPEKPPEPMLTGRECAALIREWMERDGYSQEMADALLAELPWRDSPEPLITRSALSLHYWLRVDLPLRLVRLGRLHERMSREP